MWVWRRSSEGSYRPDLYGDRLDSKTTIFKVNIWGCISYFGGGTLKVLEGTVNANKYIDILDESLWPVIAKHFPQGDFLLQEDNAPIHKAGVVKKWMSDHNLSPITWPAYSPDLNPIENCWSVLKNQLQKEINEIKSNEDLRIRIFRIWSNLSTTYITNLYDSMPRRCRQVQILKGHLTKY